MNQRYTCDGDVYPETFLGKTLKESALGEDVSVSTELAGLNFEPVPYTKPIWQHNSSNIFFFSPFLFAAFSFLHSGCQKTL